jgi:hypothetical protein
MTDMIDDAKFRQSGYTVVTLSGKQVVLSGKTA